MATPTKDAIDANLAAVTRNSQTASQYIDEQLALEADAKEILPYKFDKCTYLLGPLRQSVFACLTCSPPPASPAQVYTPAGVCYSCSISCHGDHNLVELFKRRNFVCDCGTTRMPDSSACMLRTDSNGAKGVTSQEAGKSNTYNHNFENRFCGCEEEYDPALEKGTMYQCIGLGSVESGGCGEDWWHPECLMGLPRDWAEKGLAKARVETKTAEDEELLEESVHPIPEQFPNDEEFTSLVCYKCVESNPWIKQYAGTDGFHPALYKSQPAKIVSQTTNLKRKASSDEIERPASPTKRVKEETMPSALEGETNAATLQAEDMTNGIESGQTSTASGVSSANVQAKHRHDELPPAPDGVFSILTKEDFREKLCHCPKCYPNLIPHSQLQEEEDEYEPSISDSEASLVGGGSTRSVGTGSLLDRGEAALSTMDRVKAIEGVMAYNHIKDKVKEFLKPYAESGQEVSAADVKGYFEKLRGDQDAMKEASRKPVAGTDDQHDGRREGRGY